MDKPTQNVTDEEVLVSFGSSIRSTKEGVWGGHLVLFHKIGQEPPDDYKTYFLPPDETNYGRAKHSDVYFQHGRDPLVGKRDFDELADIGVDQWGVWIKHKLNLRRNYEAAVDALGQCRALGWSSGVPHHLIETADAGDGAKKIVKWPLGLDASYVVNPGDKRNQIVPVRSLNTRDLQSLLVEHGLRTEAVNLEKGEFAPTVHRVPEQIQGERNMPNTDPAQAAEPEGTAPEPENTDPPAAPEDKGTRDSKPAPQPQKAGKAPAVHGTTENYRALFDEIKTLKAKMDKEQQGINSISEQLKNIPATRSFSLPDDASIPEEPEEGAPIELDTNVRAIYDDERYRAAFRQALLTKSTAPVDNVRATLQLGSDVGGGYLAAPPVFVKKLLQEVDDMVAVRKLATIYQLGKSESMGCPTLDTRGSDPDKCVELSFGTEDTNMEFGGRELTPHDFAKYVMVSKKLSRKAQFSMESIIRRDFKYKFGTVMENKYCNGSANNEPLGIFTASDDGIPTGQDTTTAASATIGADDWINFVHSLKMQYWGAARILTHRYVMRDTRKIVGSVGGEYLWPNYGTGLEKNIVFSLLGFPLVISDYVPHTLLGDTYVAAMGDFSYYWIADGLDMTIEVLRELGAATNQDYFVGRLESDGMPVLSEAFVRLKLKA